MDMRKLVRFVFIVSAARCPAGSHVPCPMGFMPPDCRGRCSSGMYGVNCASVCPATCMGRSCKPDTGFCYRCQAGFTGPKCSMTCRSGFFGQDCRRLCPLNCFNNVCNPFTGFCEKCLKGYGGVTCERRSAVRNLSVPSEIIDGEEGSGRTKSLSRSVVVYVMVVIMSCVLPVCAVVLCVKCARKHSSRKMQLVAKIPAPSHTPVSFSTHPRRHGRLALKYEQMQTIEEESSNQFTLEDDIHRRAASITAVASPASLNSHDSFHNPSQKYANETSQAATLDSTNLRSVLDSPCVNPFSNVSDSSFDISQPTKGVQEVGVSHVYNQPLNAFMALPSNPTTNMCSDAVSNLIFTDVTSQKSLQASGHGNEECLHGRKGRVVSVSSETPKRVLCSATDVAQIEPGLQAVKCVVSTATAGARVEPGLEADRCEASTATAAIHVEQGDHVTPETMVQMLRGECSSSSQECVRGQGLIEDAARAELGWHQAQAIRPLDNSDGDMVALDSPSDTAEINREQTVHEAVTPPCLEKEIAVCLEVTHSVCPEDTYSVCKETHTNNTHVVKTNPFPEFLTSKMAGVAIETLPPVSHDTYTYKEREVELYSENVSSPVEYKVPATLSSTQSECHTSSEVFQTRKLETPVAAAVWKDDRNRTHGDRQTSSHEFKRRTGSHVARAEKHQKDILEDIGEREPDGGTGFTSGLMSFVSDKRRITAAVSSAVSSAASNDFATAVCIPVCIPVPVPVCPDVSTAVLRCCKVRGEDEILVGGSAQDAACRHVHSFDYTHLSVRHAFDNRTDGFKVLPGTSLHDLAAEEGHQQTSPVADGHTDRQTQPVADGHTDQHSSDVCKRAGRVISSSREHLTTTRSFPANGSTNNMNRLCIQTRQPPSSCTTSSLTAVPHTRHTSRLHWDSHEPTKQSILKDSGIPQTPLFSISSSAPVKLSVTYCKNGQDDEAPMCSFLLPRYFSLSSLGKLDECPAESCDPIEISVLMTSPPKHTHKKGPKRNDTDERGEDPQNHTCLPSGKRDTSHQRRASAFKCDQFRQVIYTQEHKTPFRERTAPESHLSSGKDSGITRGKFRRCETSCAVATTNDETRSHASNVTYPVVPVYRALDVNPMRTNVVPETRDMESLTPVSAIKMSLTQTHDRDILQICTSNGGAEALHSNRTREQGTQHDEVAPAVDPFTDYIKESSATNKHIYPCRPQTDRWDSSWSQNPLLMQELAHDGNLRQRKPGELTQTCSFPKSNLLQPRAVPTDDPRHLAQSRVSQTSSSTPSDANGELKWADNTARNESSLGPCKRPFTLNSYYPDLWQLGSRQDRWCTATGDHPCSVVSNDSCMVVLSPSHRSEESAPTSRDDRQTGYEMILAAVTGQDNKLISEDRYKGGPLGQKFPPNTYHHDINHEYKHDINREYKHDINHEYKHDINREYKYDINHEYKHDINSEYKNDINHEYKNDINREYKHDINHEYKHDINREYKHDINHEYKHDINCEYKNDINHEYKHDINREYKHDINREYKHDINRKQNQQRITDHVQRSKSTSLIRQNLEPVEQDQLTLYPLPSLLEELAIWEGSVSAVVANTEAGVWPGGPSHVTVAHSAIERPVRTTTDNGGRPSGSDVLYSHLCSQSSELRCQFTQNEDNRLKLEPKIYSSDHNKEGSDSNFMVEQKCIPHTGFDTFGNYDELSYYCKSKVDKPVSQERRPCCRNDSSEYMSLPDDASDVFFDALDSFPVAAHGCLSSREPAHNEVSIKTATDRKRAVKFVQTSSRYTSDVDFRTNKARDKVSGQHWRDGNNTGHDRLHYSSTRQQMPQQNIAFRFAVPRPNDITINNSQKSISKTRDRNRLSKQAHPLGGQDLTGSLPSDKHRKYTSTKLSLCEKTEHKTKPSMNKSHAGSNTSKRIMGVEGNDSAAHRNVSPEKDTCLMKDQHSVAEDFFSVRE